MIYQIILIENERIMLDRQTKRKEKQLTSSNNLIMVDGNAMKVLPSYCNTCVLKHLKKVIKMKKVSLQPQSR